MTLSIEKRFLLFPVSRTVPHKKVTFSLNGEVVQTLFIDIDLCHPTFTAFVDVGRFDGKELEMTIEPAISFLPEQRDTMELPGEYHEPFRPQLHYSTKNGWSNDPNGLCFYEGQYHLFYQHNPCSTGWQNMEWNHAVSRDLLHWEERGVALFTGMDNMIWSGGAVVDTNNVSGLQTGEHPPLLLFYTDRREDEMSQCLAYSTDGGRTFCPYAHNPLIPRLSEENRDPCVVWCAEIGKWVMALFVKACTYGLFTSDDLLHWTPLQDISIRGDNECPDLFFMTASDGQKKWVLMGAADTYTVGDFTDGQFVPSQETRPMQSGGVHYAGQHFANLPDGRIVRMAWLRTAIPEDRFSQAFSFPADYRLQAEGNGYRMHTAPIAEVDSLTDKTVFDGELSLSSEEAFTIPLSPAAYDLTLSFTRPGNGTLEWLLFGMLLRWSSVGNRLSLVKNGGDLIREQTVDLPDDARVTLRLLFDRSCFDAYLNDGVLRFSQQFLADDNLPYLRLSVSCPLPVTLTVRRLASIWE